MYSQYLKHYEQLNEGFQMKKSEKGILGMLSYM